MLPLNLCHLSDLIMHINKKSQPINALRQVRSFSLSIPRRHALHVLLSRVHPQIFFCCPAHIRRQSSTALRTVRTQMHYHAAYCHSRHAPKKNIVPRTFTVRTHLNHCCSAYPRSSPVSELRTHAVLLFLRCVPMQSPFFCSAYPRRGTVKHLHTIK